MNTYEPTEDEGNLLVKETQECKTQPQIPYAAYGHEGPASHSDSWMSGGARPPAARS